MQLFFSFDDVPRDLLTESGAYYLVDGPLRLEDRIGVVFQEDGVPLVELAVWLSAWLASPQQACSFLPEGYDEDYGPMLNLAPADGTCYRLTYAYGEPTTSRVAEQAEWEVTFGQFIMDLRQAVQAQYQVSLDKVLPPVRTF